MSAHTPAPWRVEGKIKIAGNTGHIISHGLNSRYDGPEGYVCNALGTSEADAALIAAAPDLLAACHRALEYVEADETQHGRTFGVGNDLRAAIAKAGAA